MTALQRRIQRAIDRHGLWPPGAGVLVALSGGSDSTALLWLLRELAEAGAFRVVGAAHFNHQLRPTAPRDATFCREAATRAGVRLVTGSGDVRALAVARGLSLEDAARRARYEFLERAAVDLKADRVATGHTRDDQTETFLLKLSRGAGTTGLGGIYPVRGIVVRPLLDLTRQELRDYLVGRGEEWVEDESNEDLANPRNRVRHVVLPQLDRAWGEAVRARIAGAALRAGEDGAWLDRLAADQLQVLGRRRADAVEFDAQAVRDLPAPIGRRVLLEAMRSLSEDREVGADHVEAALDVLRGRCRATQTPGGRWELFDAKLVLLSGVRTADAHPFDYRLEIPGQVDVVEVQCRITAERVDAASAGPGVPPGVEGVLVAATGLGALQVRSRRPGDRLALASGRGRKKVQDVLVDAKVPRAERDRIPLVATPEGQVVWLPGHGISADFRPGAQGGVILLRLIRVGGKA